MFCLELFRSRILSFRLCCYDRVTIAAIPLATNFASRHVVEDQAGITVLVLLFHYAPYISSMTTIDLYDEAPARVLYREGRCPSWGVHGESYILLYVRENSKLCQLRQGPRPCVESET